MNYCARYKTFNKLGSHNEISYKSYCLLGGVKNKTLYKVAHSKPYNYTTYHYSPYI